MLFQWGKWNALIRTVNKEKKGLGVYHVLEKYDLKTEQKLEDARKFVQAVIDFKTFR